MQNTYVNIGSRDGSLVRHFAALFFLSLLVPISLLADVPAEVDLLVTVYESSRGEVRIAAGRRLLSLCSDQRALFKDNLELTSSMAPRRQNLVINFAAERYLLTTSYFKEALVYNEKALPMAEEEEDADIHCTLLCDQAYCLFKLSDYSRAVETGQQAMRLCQQEGNTLQLSRAYLYLSLVNHALRKYDEAKALVVKAIETNEKLGDNMQLHNALGVACEIFCSALEVDQAIEYGKRAVEAARAIDFQPGVANHMTQLSYAYDRKGEYELGLQMADSAIAIVKAQEPLDRNQLAITLEYKGWNLIDIGRNAEAVEALREAIRLEEEVGNTHAAWYDYRTLAEAMAPIDARGALDVLNRYVRMSDTIHAQQLKELMSQANAEFHNDELQEANVESRRMNRIIFWTSLIVFNLLAMVIASLLFAFRQKKRTADTLRRLTEARESFFTNVTHEFRTPLTVILGLGKELQNTPPADTKRLQEAGEIIERQGTRLLTLVNQMLDISKVKSAMGKQPQQYGDIAAVATMVMETLREAGRQKGVEVTFDTDEGGIQANFVPDYADKIITNLVGNAVKFTPEGGSVHAALHRVGEQLELTVEDTGCGIAADALPHIFEPFYRADNAEATGSGVGLALVKQIVDAEHGDIQVTSEVGKGTKVKVLWNPGKHPAASLTTREEPEDLSGKASSDAVSAPTTYENTPTTSEPAESETALPTLLIVEDSPDVARYMGHLLEGQYELHFATNGQQGLLMARELLPDLIITDVMMPYTDGLQLCRSIRADELTSHIPIIVVTAKATEADRVRGLQEGADAYLYKPFNEQELYVRIQKLLETRRMIQEKYAKLSDMNRKPSQNTPLDEKSSAAEAAFEPSSFSQHSTSFVRQFEEVFQRQLATGNADVESIAAELCISTSQLRRKMNVITGMSPKKYIMRMRLEQAHKEIQQFPNKKLSVIAERCGFYDLPHFIRIYKEAYGITPGRERQDDEK